MTTTELRSLVMATLAAFVVSACGDDGGGDSGGEATGTTGTTGTASTPTTLTATGSTTTSTSTSTSTSTTDATGTTGTGTDTDATGTDTGGGGVTCALIFICIEDCADEACALACLDAGLPEAQMEAIEVLECDESNMCDGDPDCLDQNCLDEQLACFTGDLTCTEIAECLDTCNDDQVCELACFYEGTVDAQDLYGAIIECAIDNDCQDDMCLEQNCDAELAACFG